MKTPKVQTLVLFLVCATGLSALQAEPSRQTAVVESVSAGNLVRLKGGKELRYTSVDSPSPESEIPLARQYGEAAREFNRALVEGKTIQIEWGPQLRDRQNRLLGFVFLEDGTFVNREILKMGHGKARVQPPNLRYAEEFRRDESEAHRQKLGLWLKEPEDPKADQGLLGNKVGKIFYYPDSPELEGVPQAQLVRFRSRVEAVAAGYKPCYSCRNHSAAYGTESA